MDHNSEIVAAKLTGKVVVLAELRGLSSERLAPHVIVLGHVRQSPEQWLVDINLSFDITEPGVSNTILIRCCGKYSEHALSPHRRLLAIGDTHSHLITIRLPDGLKDQTP